ncbi:S41 family peptidase [Lacibacter sp. H375]|uniref:S41 family peptidase n=1 Tax=Lacibacter sp. H375 TaxID=3133424 RepID=UPI0030C5959E
MKKIIPVVFLLFSFGTVYAQAQGADSSALFNAEQLRADLDTLHHWVLSSHPKLYGNADSVETEKKWQQVRSELNGSLSRPAFMKILAPLLAQYNDGHTFVETDFESQELKAFKAGGGRFLSYEITIQENEVWVKQDHDTLMQVKPGSRILSINNKPINEIITELYNAMSGDHKANRLATASRLFGFLLWNQYGWSAPFSLQVQEPGGTIRNVKSVAVSVDDYLKNLFPSPLWTMDIYPEENLAVIECRSYSGNMERIREKLDSFFTIIKQRNIQHVALDLRRNGGGNSMIGTLFLSYLTQKPLLSVNSKSFRESKRLHALPADFWLKKQFDNALKTWKRDGEFLTTYFESDNPLQLTKPELFFKGNFYLLTSARTYSSAHMTAMQVKCSKLGVIIGQPTGEQIDLTGEILNSKLPHSNIFVYIPTAMFTASCKWKEKMGVQPDHITAFDPNHLANAVDTELAFLKQLINAKK